MRLRQFPRFLPTRREPAFSNVGRGVKWDNSLNPLHFVALREVRELPGATGPSAALRRLAAFFQTAFVPPAGEKFP